jgi:hypothetical protein
MDPVVTSAIAVTAGRRPAGANCGSTLAKKTAIFGLPNASRGSGAATPPPRTALDFVAAGEREI